MGNVKVKFCNAFYKTNTALMSVCVRVCYHCSETLKTTMPPLTKPDWSVHSEILPLPVLYQVTV